MKHTFAPVVHANDGGAVSKIIRRLLRPGGIFFGAVLRSGSVKLAALAEHVAYWHTPRERVGVRVTAIPELSVALAARVGRGQPEWDSDAARLVDLEGCLLRKLAPVLKTLQVLERTVLRNVVD